MIMPPREGLLQPADDLFLPEGIHAVGINRILETPQTPITSLYRNLGSKDAYLERRGERNAEVVIVEARGMRHRRER